MKSLRLPNVAANLFDPNDICGFCGSKMIAADRVGQKLATACMNRNCQFRECPCVGDFRQNIETKYCPAHWKCDCREGYLCGRHRLRPEHVQWRAKLKGKEWCDFTGFSNIHDQANLWVKACSEQEEKVIRTHCGNCFSLLRKSKVKTGLGICPNGCDCNCGTDKKCHVHFECSCVQGHEVCQFHKTKKPEVLVALYRALPPIRIRPKLLDKMIRARIQPTDYPQRGKRPYELDIKELVRKSGMKILPTAVKQPLAATTTATIVELDVLKREPIETTKFKNTASARAKKVTEAKFDLASDLQSKATDYKIWLAKQGLSPHSTRNYLSRINSIISLIKEMNDDYPPLSAATKDFVVRDIKKHLQKKTKLKPTTLNSYLSAIDNFYAFLGLGKTAIVREDLPQEAPRALTPGEQKKFLRAVELTRRSKDRAIATLLFYTGMRLSECASLELDDVFVVGRKTRAIIRSGKGGCYREIPLNSLICEVIQNWLAERKEKYAGKSDSRAVFLNPQGAPMLPNSIYEIVKKIGRDAGLELSPHTLRHTCLTALVRKQNDVVLVADIAGHKSLNTTKRYSLPTATDKAKALEQLLNN
jgi:site-specific recombinase XerD